MAGELNFPLDDLRHVYVSSCRRGFTAISDNPGCVTTAISTNSLPRSILDIRMDATLTGASLSRRSRIFAQVRGLQGKKELKV